MLYDIGDDVVGLAMEHQNEQYWQRSVGSA